MIKLIYDGDPGIDDALAILYALNSPKTILQGITTVAGNVTIDKTTKNALNLLEMAERSEIPVAKGAAKPLLRELRQAEEFHGPDGLGNTNLPEPKLKPEPIHAMDQIISSIMANKGDIALVAAGPLTNLAMAVLKEPNIRFHVRKVIIMGGAIRAPGNVTMASEFNIYTDPEAAKIVFNSGLPIILVSLDEELMTESENIYVDVETEGKITLGKTQADLRRYSKCQPSLTHCVQIDYEKFFNDFVDTLRRK